MYRHYALVASNLVAALVLLPVVARAHPFDALRGRLLAASAGSSAATGVLIRSSLYDDTVTGFGAPGAPVAATLREGGQGGAFRAEGQATVNRGGEFTLTLRAVDGRAVRTAPGNRLIVAMGTGPAVDLLLPAISGSADPAADVVAGLAPPHAPLRIMVDAPEDIFVETIAEDSGRFAADFSGQFDILPGTTGHVVMSRPDGHEVALEWAAPRLEVFPGEVSVSGVGPSGRLVSVMLSRDGYVLGRAEGIIASPSAGGAPNWSLKLVDDEGNPVRVHADDWLSVSVAGWALDLQLPLVTTEANTAAETVTGLAPRGDLVKVTAAREDHERTFSATADVNGRYVADLAGQWDLTPGDRVTTEALAAEDQVSLSVSEDASGLSVMLETGILGGYAHFGAAVAIALSDPAGGVRAAVETTAGGTGRFEATLRAASGAVVLPNAGDMLTVIFGSDVVTMTIPVLTVDVDLEADVVEGDAPTDGVVTVRVEPGYGQPSLGRALKVTPTKLGRYGAEFSGEVDLAAGTRIEVALRSPSGHVARIDRTVPVLHAQVGGNLVSGFAQPQSAVTVTLARNGAVWAANTSASAGTDGSFEVTLGRTGASPVMISSQDQLSVTSSGGLGPPWPGGGLITHTVGAVSGTVGITDRTVYGTGPPDTQVYLIVHGLGFARGTLQRTATTDASGAFTRTIPGRGSDAPLPAGSSVEVGIHDERGHRTYARLVAPYLEFTMGGREINGRAAPMATLSLTLTADDTVVASTQASSDTFGGFTAVFSPTAEAIGVGSGQQLVLREPGGRTTKIDVPRLSIEIDPMEHALKGTGPVSSTLQLRLFVPGRPTVPLATQTDAAGEWTIRDEDLPPEVTFTIADLTQAEVLLRVDNGHLVRARASARLTPTATPSATRTPSATPTRATSPAPTPSATATNSPTPVPHRGLYIPLAVKAHDLGRV